MNAAIEGGANSGQIAQRINHDKITVKLNAELS